MTASRRVLLVILAVGLLALPIALDAQQPAKAFRIGILSNVPLSDPEGARVWGAFTQGLRDGSSPSPSFPGWLFWGIRPVSPTRAGWAR